MMAREILIEVQAPQEQQRAEQSQFQSEFIVEDIPKFLKLSPASRREEAAKLLNGALNTYAYRKMKLTRLLNEGGDTFRIYRTLQYALATVEPMLWWLSAEPVLCLPDELRLVATMTFIDCQRFKTMLLEDASIKAMLKHARARADLKAV